MSEVDNEDVGPSPPKRSRLPPAEPDLGERLNLLMLCIVCHEVPHPDKSYQCSVGHIVCNDCVSHILADAVISFAEAQCPICRVRLSWNDLAQNAVVRQALWEMSKNCPLCSKLVPLKKLDRHIEKDCQQRKVSCMYRCLGCDWMGVYETCPIHEAGCLFPKMKSEEIQRALEKADRIQRKHQKQAVRFHQELSQRRIFYRNLEFFWKNDWGMTQERFLDSLSFEAYGNHWILRIKIGLSVDDIPVRVGTTLLVQVPPQEVITVRYLVLMPNRQGNDTQMQDILANLIECQVSTSRTMEIYEDLPMQSPMALYRLLAKQRIVLRLWIFMP